jgi:hypothetical protein
LDIRRNRLTNWFKYKIRSYEYGKNYKQEWQERGARLLEIHESSEDSKRQAKILAKYLTGVINVGGSNRFRIWL